MAAPEVERIDYDSDEDGNAPHSNEKTPCTGEYGKAGDSARRVVREPTQNFIDEVFRPTVHDDFGSVRKQDYPRRRNAGAPLLEATSSHGGKVRQFRFHDGKGYEYGRIVYSEIPMAGKRRMLKAPFFYSINHDVHATRTILLKFRSDKEGRNSTEAGEFGEGNKVAGANALRFGWKMTVMIPKTVCHYQFTPADGPLRNRDVTANMGTRANKKARSMVVLIEGIDRPGAFAEIDYLRLLAPDHPGLAGSTCVTDADGYYRRVFDSPVMRGRVYVKGILCFVDDRLAAGYDFNAVEIGRDRDRLHDEELCEEIRIAWTGAVAARPELAAPAYDMLLGLIRQWREDNAFREWPSNPSGDDKTFADAMARVFRERHGADGAWPGFGDNDRGLITWGLDAKYVEVRSTALLSVLKTGDSTRFRAQPQLDALAKTAPVGVGRHGPFLLALSNAVLEARKTDSHGRPIKSVVCKMLDGTGSSAWIAARFDNSTGEYSLLVSATKAMPGKSSDQVERINVAQAAFDLFCRNQSSAARFFAAAFAPDPIAPATPAEAVAADPPAAEEESSGVPIMEEETEAPAAQLRPASDELRTLKRKCQARVLQLSEEVAGEPTFSAVFASRSAEHSFELERERGWTKGLELLNKASAKRSKLAELTVTFSAQDVAPGDASSEASVPDRGSH